MADNFLKVYNGLDLKPRNNDPSNPTEGDIQFSDGTHRAKGLWQYVDGAWEQTGGGSGVGGINYIENYDFEQNVDGWNTYDDGAVDIPVDGTGGTASNLTISRQTLSPLRGSGMLQFSKASADAQGEGVSYDFTVDRADKSKKLTISFDYDTSTANYDDGDVKVYIYDVDNSNIIRVNGEDLKATSGNGTHYAQFQTSAISDNYRLIFHITTTKAIGFSIWFDNIQVGPSEIAYGSIVTDWKATGVSFDTAIKGNTTDPTFSSTPGKDNIFVKRVGDTLHVRGNYYHASATGTAAGSGAYYLDLTALGGYSIDTAKLSEQANRNEFGYAQVGTSSGQFMGTMSYRSATSLFIRATASQTDARSANVGTIHTVANTEYSLSFEFKVPISGWSSNAQMSEDLGGREIAFYGVLTGNQTVSSASETTVDIANTIFDTSGSFDTANNKFVVPESGKYVFTIKAYDSGYADAYIRLRIKEGGSTELYRVDAETANSVVGISQTTPPLNLTKGQEITFTVQSVADTSYILAAGTQNTFFTGYKLATPQTILETETVAARYTSNSGLTMTNNVLTQVAYEVLDYDTHNCVSSGIFTAPYSAYYNYTYTARLDSLSTDTGRIVQDVEKNGSSVQRKYIQIVNSTLQSVEISGNVYLNKGDTLEYNINQNNGANRNLATDGTYNTMQIHRIK